MQIDQKWNPPTVHTTTKRSSKYRLELLPERGTSCMRVRVCVCARPLSVALP